MVPNSQPVYDDRAILAIKYLIRPSQLFFERSRNRDQLESRSRFVDVADCMVFQPGRPNLSRVIGVERRPVRQRQNFASTRIFYQYGSRFRVGLRHGCFQFAFRDVLDTLIDSEHHTLAGVGLFLHAAEPLAARVD